MLCLLKVLVFLTGRGPARTLLVMSATLSLKVLTINCHDLKVDEVTLSKGFFDRGEAMQSFPKKGIVH